MARDPHLVLGLAPGASAAEVKRAYRRLAKEHHPDSAGEVALPRFLEIQRAYEQLSSTSWRPGLRRPAAAEPWRADPTRARWTPGAAGTSGRRAEATGAAGKAASGKGRAAPGTRRRRDSNSGYRRASGRLNRTPSPREEGDLRLDHVRRGARRRGPHLGGCVVVRTHERRVLAGQPARVRRSAQARAGVPRPGSREGGGCRRATREAGGRVRPGWAPDPTGEPRRGAPGPTGPEEPAESTGHAGTADPGGHRVVAGSRPRRGRHPGRRPRVSHALVGRRPAGRHGPTERRRLA